ncbi:Pentraxin-4 [Fukomys damarensis]|uniref:Pentraxin-4 n=2 Tax=Fukomys damarensis TaxID=885580 RepID=A0A091DRJ8_FUKDA|nr:Pentraxin-4 [Fukomys damarensis]
MGCPGRRTLPLLFVCVPVYLYGVSLQEAHPIGQRKPFFERLRRLEEQFRRFQEVTLTHLQRIANNYNVSYNVDARFQRLTEESRAVALAVNRSQAAMQVDLAHLKTQMRKTKRRGRKVNARLRALDLTLSRQQAWEEERQKAPQDAVSRLALDVPTLQNALARLAHQVRSQSTRLAALEGQLQVANPGALAQGLILAPHQPDVSSPKLHQERQALRPPPEHKNLSQDFAAILQGTQKPPSLSIHWASPAVPGDPPQLAWPPQGPGKICNTGPVFVFPNASTENVVFLSPGFLKALRALSFCSWVRVASSHLGTLLSYATEENDNKLVLHGRDSLVPGSMHFVIGDPAFRELRLQPLLDSRWHHLCVGWTSIQGRYWLYVDRKLVASGSHFRENYEIPPGGSLVLGQEQDIVGGGFDSAEAFVGSMSGLAIWDRALMPGDVANLFSEKKLPAGAILTLANATLVGGFVQRTNCPCLEDCP